MNKISAILFALSISAIGCSDTTTSTYVNALTGEECQPSEVTMVQMSAPEPKNSCTKSNNGHGNNHDGVDSSNPGKGKGGPNGEVDESCDGSDECVDDEMKKQHKKDKEECEVPPGCDDSLCCDADVLVPNDDGGAEDSSTPDGSPDSTDEGSPDTPEDGGGSTVPEAPAPDDSPGSDDGVDDIVVN